MSNLDIISIILSNLFNKALLVTGAVGFCGAMPLIIGGNTLEKWNTLLNKEIFSIGPSFKKVDKSIADIDGWVLKRSRLIGIAVLIISLVFILNFKPYLR